MLSETTLQENGFKRLISQLSPKSKVLDVGAGGLQGTNTTDFLIERFGADNVTGICTSEKEVLTYHAQRKEKGLPKINIKIGDF